MKVGVTFNEVVDYVKTRADKLYGPGRWRIMLSTFTHGTVAYIYNEFCDTLRLAGSVQLEPLVAIKDLAQKLNVEFEKQCPSKNGTEIEVDGRRYKLIEKTY